MELWVRGQNKETLMKIRELVIEQGTEYFSILNYSENDKWSRLGRYKTKERALEVFDEIQDLLDDMADNKIVGCVYQMPED